MKLLFLLLVIINLSFLLNCTSKKNHEVTTDVLPPVPSDTMAWVLKDGLYGAINSSGQYLIQPQYPLARTFSNGLACVNKGGLRTSSGVAGGNYQAINQKNEIQFNGMSFVQPFAFYHHYAVVQQSNGKMGMIDRNGKTITADFDALSQLHEGLAAAMKKNEKLLGYIDTTGNWRIHMPFECTIGDFHEGRAWFRMNKRYGYISPEGKYVIPQQFDEAFDFHHGRAVIRQGKLFGVIDRYGKIMVKPFYEDAGDFQEYLCAVKKDGQWGFIDTNGTVMIDFQYDNVRNFHEGLAAVLVKDKAGYINTSGQLVIQPMFENAVDFSCGLAIIQKNKKMGYINKSGTVVIEPVFDRADPFVQIHETNEIIRIN